MSDSKTPRRGWLLRLQSSYVLPMARGLYLLIALGCLLAVLMGLAYVGYLKVSPGSPPTAQPLPPAYSGPAPKVDTSNREINLDAIDAKLVPPTDIEFLVTAGPMREPPPPRKFIGRFSAKTPNGLADYPQDVSILGGPDAALFERVRYGSTKYTGLAPRTELIEEIAETLKTADTETPRTFELRVVARDRFGLVSPPTDVSFTLKIDPSDKEVPESTSQDVDVHESEPAELQQIAREIASTLEPEINPDHFAAYRTALKTPNQCGANDDDTVFLANYRRAVEARRDQLTESNIGAFYSGLCEAWKTVLQQEADELARARQRYQQAVDRADAARQRVLVQNRAEQNTYERRVQSAAAQMSEAWPIIVGALGAFLSVSLMLAFLAIENHTRAVRAAVETLSGTAGDGAKASSTPEASKTNKGTETGDRRKPGTDE